SAALATVEEMINSRAEAKGLAFTVERAADLPTHVLGDGPHLRQVLLNLLGNAVKYTEAGRVTLSVERSGEERVRFAVSDTGPGIAPEEQERI
ncbi:MAG: ATP-binding protein, partial [Rhodocyclaceae bacterium]|nr:ATP-binding protein [Rhodocyclaceae bacterium]